MDTQPKPFVFVLMPFDAEFDDVYKLGIKAPSEKAGAYCERLDEQLFTENMLQRVYNQISAADVLVADMTGRNPNVFYEVGYAHALGKRVLLLTKSADDIPFDLKHYPHIVYEESITSLAEEVERRVAWMIDTGADEHNTSAEKLEWFSKGQKLQDGMQIQIETNANPPRDGSLRLAFTNASNRVVRRNIEVGLVVPKSIRFLGRSNSVTLPDGRVMGIKNSNASLYPGSWGSVQFPLRFGLQCPVLVGLEVRIFGPAETRTIQIAAGLTPAS